MVPGHHCRTHTCQSESGAVCLLFQTHRQRVNLDANTASRQRHTQGRSCACFTSRVTNVRADTRTQPGAQIAFSRTPTGTLRPTGQGAIDDNHICKITCRTQKHFTGKARTEKAVVQSVVHVDTVPVHKCRPTKKHTCAHMLGHAPHCTELPVRGPTACSVHPLQKCLTRGSALFTTHR